MALIKKKVTSIKWPVTVTSPSDGGKWRTESFTGIFKKVGITQIEKLADKGDPQLVKDVLEGWEDIKDEDGNDVAFTKKELENLVTAYNKKYRNKRGW